MVEGLQDGRLLLRSKLEERDSVGGAVVVVDGVADDLEQPPPLLEPRRVARLEAARGERCRDAGPQLARGLVGVVAVPQALDQREVLALGGPPRALVQPLGHRARRPHGLARRSTSCSCLAGAAIGRGRRNRAARHRAALMRSVAAAQDALLLRPLQARRPWS